MGFGWFSKGTDRGDKSLAKAQKLLTQERWAEALTFFDEALGQDPDRRVAVHGSRTCRENLVSFNLEEAEAYRETDPAKAREHAALALDLARSHDDLRQRAQAVLTSLARPISTSPPESPKQRQPLFAGSCSCAVPCSAPTDENRDEADIDVDDLAEFYLDSCEPETREVFSRLGSTFRAGFVHLQQGEPGRARPFLEQATTEHPGEPGPPHALGLLASIEGSNDLAVHHFETALKADPDFGPALRHLAEIQREKGEPSRAVNLLSAWLDRHGEDGEARVLLAACLIEIQDFSAAIEQARLAQGAIEETDFRPAFLSARAFRLSGDETRAMSALQGILARKPDALDALVELAGLLLSRGKDQAEGAAEAFKKCYRLDPERGWWYLLKVSEAYWMRGWEPQARELLGRARDELPDDPEAHEIWRTTAQAQAYPA